MSENARLSYDLLSRLRLDRDADLSVVRAAESLRKADRVKLLASSAKVAHLMVRASTSVFNVSLQLVDSGKVQFKCECEAFKNGYVCSHILASVQYLAELLREKEGGETGTFHVKPAAWQADLETVFGDLSPATVAPRRPPSQRHLLFFSVQERASDRWGIYPYSLPAKLFPETFFGDDGERTASGDEIAKFIRTQKIAREAAGVRAVEAARFPFASPEERQAAGLLSAVASFGGYGYYYGSVPAGVYEQVLALLPGSPFVYHGTESTPLRQHLRLCRDELSPAVQVNNAAGGLSVVPVLEGGGESVSLRGKNKWALKSPSYLLTENGVMLPLPTGTPDAFAQLLERGELTVPDAGKSLFVERYLVPLAQLLPVTGSAIVWQTPDADAPTPTPRLYLSEENTRLSAELRFAYPAETGAETAEYPFDPAFPAGAIETVPSESGADKIALRRVARDPQAEEARFATLSGTGGAAFGVKRGEEAGRFTLRARVDPVDFLLHYVPKLAEAGYEVFGDESLKSVRVNRNKPRVSWSVASGIDWFDLDAMVTFGDTAATFAELKRAIRRREKYVKLADGSIGVIPPEIVERFRFLFALGEEKDGILRLSPTQAVLLEAALADEESDFKADADFYERRDKLRSFTEIKPVPLPTTGLTATLYPYQKAGFDWLHFLHEYGFGGCLADEMGLGKAQPLDAKVLTPDGFVPMGSVKVGDAVIGANGAPTRVAGVYPQGRREVFRVTFSDGAATECCDEHLWQVTDCVSRETSVKTLHEIRHSLTDNEGELHYIVPVVAPVQFAQTATEIAPIEERITALQSYLDAGAQMSTDGSASIYFRSLLLGDAEQVQTLVRSLGGTASHWTTGAEGWKPLHHVAVRLPIFIEPFRTPDKARSYSLFARNLAPTRAIVSVEPVGEKETQCIRVEAADHLYVTDDFIVTHNTLSALSFLLSLRKGGGSDHAAAPDLVIAPKSLVFNWEREAARFTPGLKTLVYTESNRAKTAAAFAGVDVVLTTYGIMLRDIEHLRKTRFHCTVLDEAQAIKNPLSQSARAARLLNTEHRLTLTGTPVENGTIELWSQFAFLNPGHLGNIESFKKEFAGAIEQDGDKEAAQTLRRLIAPFLLRRTKAQVAPQLPPRTEQIVTCEMDKIQRKRYEETRDRYRAEVLGLLDEAETDRALAGRGQMKMLEALLRLRQVCNHPRLADKTYTGDSAKFGVLLDTMETLRAENHKALVFSQFVQMLDLLRAELDKRGIPYCYLDGSTRNRRAPVDRFQTDASVPLFLISLKAGGVGLNLTAADYVLHVDPWWNPAAERQATDRAHRIGQNKPVFVQKFITKDTVEEKILALQERKRAITDQLITAEEGGFLKTLSRDDIAGLFE